MAAAPAPEEEAPDIAPIIVDFAPDNVPGSAGMPFTLAPWK
jgi:hypothetical protein